MSIEEMNSLKEQIKKELLIEMNTKKENQNNWKKIKEEYKDEFKKFNYIDHWECTSSEGRLISRDKEINAEYPLQNALGTILRIVYKAETVNKINAEYEDVKDTVEKIMKILKEKVGIENE